MQRSWPIFASRRLVRAILPTLAGLALGTSWADIQAFAADKTFNVSLVSEVDPLPFSSPQYYGDVWVDGNYAYLGTDVNGGGVSIFDISVPSNPTFIRNPLNPSGPVTMPTYPGDQMEDMEVYNGIGYFGSDVSTTSGTGVDVVDLSDPTNPMMISRINGANGGHNKVHTLSYSEGFLYTADNATDVIKIFDVSDPGIPQLKWSVDLGLPSGQASHEVVVKNGKMYVASKNNSFSGDDATSFNTGTTAIYDVSNVGASAPTRLKLWATGARSHTSMVSADGNLLVVAQERPNGNVALYDISMIDQPNDPDAPILLSTLNRTNVGIDAHSPHHPHLHGDMLVLSWYEAGVTIFNIADPTNPVLTGAYDTYTGTSTSYNGNWGNFVQLNSEGILQNVFLSDRTRGLMVVDVSAAASTGNFNQDAIVDGADFLAWQRNFGVASNATLAMGDGNRDKKVGKPDLDVWQFQFGESGAHHAISAVPEASSALLAAFGLTFVGTRTRRRR
ncbi:MAG: hypothetical protein JNL18_12195 [Planctomycetaceae bacterium]|nr:hypothetical protein [Planctomycetaceae bacterium]